VQKQPLIYWLKWLISVVFVVILYFRITDLHAIHFDIDQILAKHWPLVLLSFLLVVVNWGLEALKWQLLLRHSIPVRWFDALKYVLSGVTLGFITPGRTGEFAGRMILLPEGKRLQTIVLSMLGGMAQIIPIVIFGILISVIGPFHVLGQTIDITLLSIALLCFITVYFFFNRCCEWHWLRTYLLKIDVSSAILPTLQQKAIVMALAFLRFGVFVLQYALLLKAADIPFTASFAPIGWMLLLQSFSPAVALLDLGVRGNIALWVFNAFGLMNNSVLAAVFLVWFINLCFPALVGYFFILQWKKQNSLNNVAAH
jgi:hypothetical protein